MRAGQGQRCRRRDQQRIIDPLHDGDLAHVAILGGDELVPMARLEDATTVANEYDYRCEFDGDLIESFDASGDPILFDDGRNALPRPHGTA